MLHSEELQGVCRVDVGLGAWVRVAFSFHYGTASVMVVSSCAVAALGELEVLERRHVLIVVGYCKKAR